MTGTITLSDGGQNYIEFDIIDNLIAEVRPALLAGWQGCRIVNMVFTVGGNLKVRLWNNYELPLKYKISKVEPEEIILPWGKVADGVATSTVSFSLIDTVTDFVKTGIKTEDIVSNETTGAMANVSKVESETELLIDKDIMSENDVYSIYRKAEV
jgi:hypothetical protein